MKTIETQSFKKIAKHQNKEDKIKDVKKPNSFRQPWDSESDFNSKLRDEFSGEADKKKEDNLDDQWKMLINKHKRPSIAKSNRITIEAKKKA
jgi:hypothetical protein